jgi:tetratricopeptide (TPR) repeat protein
VNQRFEHLSDAQIEQFGKRASGAGPETEAWVESHLDDCSSCRSRVLEFQRTQFALLPEPKVNKVSTSDCSSEDDLRNLAAGLCAEPIANRLKAHASNCERCGPLLQEYIEDFSDESSPEEQAFLSQLRTASPEYRKQKALEMLNREMFKKNLVTPAPVPATDWRRFFSWKWMMVPAIAAVVVLAAIIFPVYLAGRDTPEKAEKQLAQAYTENRTMEMRWPRSAWSPYSVQRGATSESPSTSLLEVEAAVERQTEKTLQEIAWIRVVAEKEIIAGRPQNAIPALEQALQSNPGSVPLLLDLAIAYVGQGDQTHSEENYEKSRDLLSNVLQREPTNTVALFNRALVYEHLNAKDKAAADWKTFLQTEKDIRWLGEAQKKLTDLGDLN